MFIVFDEVTDTLHSIHSGEESARMSTIDGGRLRVRHISDLDRPQLNVLRLFVRNLYGQQANAYAQVVVL